MAFVPRGLTANDGNCENLIVPDYLYRSANLLVHVVPAADESRWFVTFNNYSDLPNFEQPGFGEHFFANAGLSAIHVKAVGNDWYQYKDLPLALATIRTHLADADRIITYGSSMGGYAALLCAASVGAHVTIALSPQFSNDPRVTPWERRWINDAHRIQWLPPLNSNAKSDAATIILFDPIGDDARHAELIAAGIPCTLIPLPYAGHPVATFLSDAGILKQLVVSVCEQKFDVSNYLQLARKQRRRSALYYGHLALAQPTCRPVFALKLAQQGLALAPDSLHSQHIMGIVLSRAGRHDEAIALLSAIVERTGNREFLHIYWLAEAFKAAGRRPEMLDQMAATVALAPKRADLWAWHAHALAQEGNFRCAVQAQAEALRLAPRNYAYRKRLRYFRFRRTVTKVRRFFGKDAKAGA